MTNDQYQPCYARNCRLVASCSVARIHPSERQLPKRRRLRNQHLTYLHTSKSYGALYEAARVHITEKKLPVVFC